MSYAFECFTELKIFPVTLGGRWGFSSTKSTNGCATEKANIKVLRMVTSLGRNNRHIEWSNSKTEFNSDIGAIPI